ncbi:cytochrome P450 2J1 [Parasteatoda tepidariorum]|uniref:cytochrome P450 2J1 n=1 Tax=Parasteatoda tepidariorum TaxID=114398 RepID=UPI001C72060A|nr:cytochrome P450 2J1 [Parasteatoda tepidariorum]
MQLSTEDNTFAFYAALVAVLLTTLYYILKKRGLPPGPTGLPFFGYYPFLDDDKIHHQLQNLGKKYGNVFSFTATGTLYINLGSAASIREALVTKSECFQHRLEEPNQLFDHLEGGMLFLKGEPWKVIRKFFLQQFRERGLTVIKKEMSGSIYDTVQSTINDLAKKKGKPVDMPSILVTKCSEIIRQAIFGNDGMTEDELKHFCNHYGEAVNTLTGTSVFPSGVIAKYFILPYLKGVKEGRKAAEMIQGVLLNAIKRRRSTYNENHVRDLVDAYIKEGNIRRSKNDPIAKYFTDKALVRTLLQVVGDGIVFVSFFITSFLNVLLEHPEEQERIYKELIEVVGEDRNPSLEDKSKLPYTNAFIAEVLRCNDLFTTFPTLECCKETTVSGYRIPKGAVLMYNFWMAHMNPDDYEEPQKFNPSRYVVKDGKKRPELPVSFGMGKRSCMGEGYTMNQVFLFLSTIVKHFHLKKPIEDKEDKTFICAHPRKES